MKIGDQVEIDIYKPVDFNRMKCGVMIMCDVMIIECLSHLRPGQGVIVIEIVDFYLRDKPHTTTGEKESVLVTKVVPPSQYQNDPGRRNA